MPSFSLSVPHTLGKEAAKAKLGTFIARMKEKYPDQAAGSNEQWEQDTLNFSLANFGIKITGRLTVEEQSIKVDGDIPFAAVMFKGKIIESIEQGLTKALAYRGPHSPEASS